MIIDVAKKLAGVIDTVALGKAIAQVWDLRSLSKDLTMALTDKALKQKDVVIEALAKEFSVFLSKINIAEEAQRIMDGMTLEVSAKVHFDKNKKSVKLDNLSKTSTKKTTAKRKRLTPKKRK